MKTVYVFNSTTKQYLGSVDITSDHLPRIAIRNLFAQTFNLDSSNVETSIKPLVNRNGSY